MCRSGEMFVRSPEKRSSEPLAGQPLSAAGSPVNPTALQENVRRLVTNVTLQENSKESFGRLNPDGSLLRTSRGSAQASLDGSLESSCMTFPKWGILSDGVVGELRTLEPAIEGSESSLLPTVTTPRPHDTEKTAGVYIESQNQKDLTYALGKNHGLKLQPAFAEWMQGFPEGWTALDASEMPSSQRKSTRSSKRSRILKTEQSK